MDQNCREYALSEDYAEFIVEFGQNLEQLTSIQNTCSAPLNTTHAVVYVPISSLPENLIQIYGYSIYPSCFGLMDNGSLEASGVTRIRNIPGFSLRGEGVLIGIIDTGIEYTHNAFKNADGTTKIYSIWDQTIQTGQSPEGFFYGSEYTQEQINLALQNTDPLSVVPSTDEDGHGTFLAGIAAGTESEENNFSGVVPFADIVVVKLRQAKQFIRRFFSIPDDAVCYQETDIMLGVTYLLNIANRLMRPLSICIGFGTSQGAHDERGVLSNYLSTVADLRGIGVSIAAGNEGNRGHHFQGIITRGTEYETVELRVGPNEGGFSMELWGDAPSTYSIDILSPTGEFIPRIPARIGETRVIRFIFEQTVIFIDYQIVETQTGDQLILIRFNTPTEGIWRFRVYSNIDLDSPFNVWLPISDFISDQTYFTQPTPETTVTSPGNTIIPIVITAYDYTNQSLYLNASRGYTRTGNVVPDLAAPGVNLIGPGLGNTYVTRSGTSVSAAHTTGIAAMILEWGIIEGNYTQLDSVEIKNLLIRGATRTPTNTYPNREWGYGILDIYNSFNSLRGDTTG
ncbi:MAG: S8 family peptidase [Anaerocolumna sp.]